jgi:diguanylate cyclase
VVFLTLTIGLLNVCLGFALAVRLGYGPPAILGWSAPGGATLLDTPDDDALSDELTEMLSADAQPDLASMLDDEAEDLFNEPMAEDEREADIRDENAADVIDEDVPENWNLDEKFVETSILKLNIAMMKSGARATKIDSRLRVARTHCDRETIQSCLHDLKEDCQNYLAEQSKAADAFHDRIGELGELSALGDEIEMTNLEQAAQIETTLSNLDNMDFESDLEAAAERLLAELDHLRAARHKLRDNQDAAFVAIARSENRMDKIEKQLYNDPLTKLPNRIGLEATLHEWWAMGKPQSRQMNAALLDLDRFVLANEQYGSAVADKLLYQVAQLIQKQCGKADLVARFSGQRFFVMAMDTGPRTAIKNIELIRQTIEKTTFVRDGQEIRLTATGAITAVDAADTEPRLLERLADTLKQTKQSGHNRTFFHDGRKASLVESPNLGAKTTEILI